MHLTVDWQQQCEPTAYRHCDEHIVLSLGLNAHIQLLHPQRQSCYDVINGVGYDRQAWLNKACELAQALRVNRSRRERGCETSTRIHWERHMHVHWRLLLIAGTLQHWQHKDQRRTLSGSQRCMAAMQHIS
jgi:hypothetical protein